MPCCFVFLVVFSDLGLLHDDVIQEFEVSYYKFQLPIINSLAISTVKLMSSSQISSFCSVSCSTHPMDLLIVPQKYFVKQLKLFSSNVSIVEKFLSLQISFSLGGNKFKNIFHCLLFLSDEVFWL